MKLTIAEVFVLCLCLQVQGYVGQTVRFGCSNYIIHEKSDRISWEESKILCEKNGSKLVSMENVSATLNFLKNTTQAKKVKPEYFIGLRKNNGTWRWISNNSTLETTEKKGKYPWAASQPSGDGNCAKIYFSTDRNDLVYDDINCSKNYWPTVGYICHRQLVECNNTNGPTIRFSTTQTLSVTSAAIQSTLSTHHQSSNSEPSTISIEEDAQETTQINMKESSTRPMTSQTSPSTTLSTQQQSDTDVPTIRISSSQSATLSEDTFDVSPDVKASKNSSFLIGIILGLLAVIILAILIIFFVLFARRRRTKKAKASLLGEQSNDRDHYLHSSTELTVHFSMSRPEEGQSTFSESKEEYTYAVVDKSKRKSRCNESSNLKQGEKQPAPPNDGHFTDHPVPVESEERIENTTEKEDKKDHVYAVVHIQQRKAAVCRDPALQEENVDATYVPNSSTHEAGGHAELLNSLSLERGKETTQNSSAADGLNECGKYLYAAVDKASKKQRPPQMPSPYRGLVYADMSHLPENKTGNINRANAPTVYAAISHQKTEGAKSSLAHQETTYNNNEL